MTELAGITLLATQVKAATGFSASNVDVADWKLLNTGASDHYAIIRPGETDRPPLSFTVKDNNYITIIEVWQRYKDDGSTLTSLLAHVDNITSRIDKYRKLADTTGTLRDANVARYGEVTEQWYKDGGVAWLKRDVFVEWTEEEAVTYAE